MDRFSEDSLKKTTVITAELLQQVKEQVEALDQEQGEYRVRSATELQAAEDEIAQFKKQADNRRKITFVVGGILLVILSFFAKPQRDLIAQARMVQPSKEKALLAVRLHKFSQEDPTRQLDESEWPNPSLSLWERMFCTGRRTSSDCTSRVLHPVYEALRRDGYVTEEIKGREQMRTLTHLNDIPGAKVITR